MLKSLLCLIFALCFLPSQSVHPSQSLNFRFASVSAKPNYKKPAYKPKNVAGCPAGQYRDIYVGDCITKGGGDANSASVEHVVPQSWFPEPDKKKNPDEWSQWKTFVTDKLHLFIARQNVNSIRGNYPFGIVDTNQWAIGACKIDQTATSPKLGDICVQNPKSEGQPDNFQAWKTALPQRVDCKQSGRKPAVCNMDITKDATNEYFKTGFGTFVITNKPIDKDGWKFGPCASIGKLKPAASTDQSFWTDIDAKNSELLCFEPPKFSKPVIAEVMRMMHDKYFATQAMGPLVKAYLTEFSREFNQKVKQAKALLEAIPNLPSRAQKVIAPSPTSKLSQQMTALLDKLMIIDTTSLSTEVERIKTDVYMTIKSSEQLEEVLNKLEPAKQLLTKVQHEEKMKQIARRSQKQENQQRQRVLKDQMKQSRRMYQRMPKNHR